MKESLFEGQILEKLVHNLEQLPRLSKVRLLEMAPDGPEPGWDALLSCNIDRKRLRLLVCVKRSGYPRDIHYSGEQLQRAMSANFPSGTVVPMIAAPSLSPGARRRLRDLEIGYWDESGSLFLALPGALFFVEKPPKSPKVTRRARNVFRGRAAQVVHALLANHEPTRTWQLSELARLAQVSIYTAHQVTRFLEAQSWVDCIGKGPKAVRIVNAPGPILEAFANEHTLESYTPHRFYCLTQSYQELKEKTFAVLQVQNARFGLTLESGAALVSPFATHIDRLSLVVEEGGNWQATLQQQGFRPVTEGENLLILATKDRSPLLFLQEIAGETIVSNVQLYLDLWSYPRRGQEQAGHLRTERLGY